VEKTPAMETRLKQNIAYFSAFFFLGAAIASLGPTLPGLAARVKLDVPALGILFSTRSFGYLFGSLLAGWILERIRGHILLRIILLLVGLVLAYIPWIPSLILLGFAFFTVGLGLGSMDVSSNTLLARVHGRESGPYLNAMYLAAGVGSFLIPLFLAGVSLTTGYITLGLFSLPLILWLSITPSPQMPAPRQEKEKRGIRVTVLILFALMAFLYIGLEVSYGGWIFTYFQESGLGPERSAYTITSLFWLAITLGRLIAIPIASRVAPIHTIPWYLFSGLLSTGLILIFRDQTWPVWIGTAGIGLSLATLFPTTFNYIQRTHELSSSLSGVVWSAGSAGGILLPFLIGRVMQIFHPSAMMVLVLLTWVLALAAFFLLLRKNQDWKKMGAGRESA